MGVQVNLPIFIYFYFYISNSFSMGRFISTWELTSSCVRFYIFNHKGLTLLCNLCSLKSLLNVIFNRNNKIHHLKCTKHMLQNYAQKKLLNIVNFTSKTGLKICKTKAKQGDSEIFIDNNAHCLFMHINISKFKKIVCFISLWTFYHWILPNRHVSNIQQISGFFVVNQWLINVFKILIWLKNKII